MIQRAALSDYLNKAQTARVVDPANKVIKAGVVLGDIYNAIPVTESGAINVAVSGGRSQPRYETTWHLQRVNQILSTSEVMKGKGEFSTLDFSFKPDDFKGLGEFQQGAFEMHQKFLKSEPLVEFQNELSKLAGQDFAKSTTVPYSGFTMGSIIPLVGHFAEALSSKLGKKIQSLYTASLDTVLLARAAGFGSEYLNPVNLPVLMARITYDVNAAKWVHQGATWLTSTGAGRVMNKFADYLEEMKKVPFFAERAAAEIKNLDALNTKIETLQKKSGELATAKLSITEKANRLKEVDALKKEVDTETAALMNTIYKDRDFLDFRVRTASGLLEKSVLLTQKQSSNLMDWLKKKPATK